VSRTRAEDEDGLDSEFAKVIKGTGIEPPAPQERRATAAKRLAKVRARTLINALVGY
jgi:hypothetical protein